ncbi:uncharacterized protein LOC131673590 [Phymastichus coffea]|uniref:uncharacterized protein LOC131673590 n=1 Tax=Phymastichus coffea TaxID=108790 RepID=UPI00273B1B8A|nr:uncharacterized protein LOC131673590 [Phymastichus coffea]
MGWALGGFGLLVVLLIVAGAAVVVCRRCGVQWQCGARDAWIVCEEWRRKVAWLWAPREEKVGLVKAQQPTGCHAMMMPGLYRQSSTTSSQYIMHSDSDLRLDAQGAFTRFEAVDRDLHPPSSALGMPGVTLHETQKRIERQLPMSSESSSASSKTRATRMPPQQATPPPRATARPRPSPLRPASTVDYLRLRECEPTPPTPPPPPSLGKLGRHQQQRGMFVFSDDGSPSPPPLPPPPLPPPPPPPPPPPRAPDALAVALAHAEILGRSGYGEDAQLRLEHGLHGIPRIPTHNPFAEEEESPEAAAAAPPRQHRIRYSVQGAVLSDSLFDEDDDGGDTSPPYGSYDIVQHEAARDLDSIFASPTRPSTESLMRRLPSSRNLRDLDRITRYIQSLPDSADFYDDEAASDEPASSAAPPPPPPPPAPPDKADQEPTTGERIFKALRAVTSQSYIDASEFYNSILSSAQHVQSLAFSARGGDAEEADEEEDEKDEEEEEGEEEEDDDEEENPGFANLAASETQQPQPPPRKSSADLYSAELNQAAQRTAQEVYKSLQDPPASPLLLKDAEQQAYSAYLQADPSFTRTSEDIFKSLEQRRKSVLSDVLELEACESERRRNSQELLSALEEVQMKRRLSQLFDEQPLDEVLLGGAARRGSLDSLLQDVEDLASLRRAVSCESVCSDTSVSLSEEARVVGLVCVGLEHDRYPNFNGDSDLIVSVLEARDLVAPDGRAAVNTFAKVCLLPDRDNFAHTRLYKDTNSPSYQEKFYFSLNGPPLGRTLLVEVFSYELPSNGRLPAEASPLGEAQLGLSPSPRPPATTWLPLVCPATPRPVLGELMFSLSYLPTAERLTLVVVKARNLRGAAETPGDFFVKVYLLQQGKKLHKKRTTIKRGEKSPIFNEAIVFGVQAHALQNVQLRLTVAEVSSDVSTKAYAVGHVIVGATAPGRALSHWRQMLASLRRPVAMWHPLRK